MSEERKGPKLQDEGSGGGAEGNISTPLGSIYFKGKRSTDLVNIISFGMLLLLCVGTYQQVEMNKRVLEEMRAQSALNQKLNCLFANQPSDIIQESVVRLCKQQFRAVGGS